MLRIYSIVLEVLKQLQPALRRIEVQDRDLGRQLRRASASIALNLGEGMYSRGQNRQVIPPDKPHDGNRVRRRSRVANEFAFGASWRGGILEG